MRAKTVVPDINSTFEDFYDFAPKELQEYVDRCFKTNQSKLWHPEGNAGKHIRIVFNRAKNTGDINYMLAAFFHDLGKADVTRAHPTKQDAWPAHGHEIISAKLVEKYADWINRLGGDVELVLYIVKEHMRAKQLDNMKPAKREAFKSHPLYAFMPAFNDFDDMRTLTSNEID